MKQCTLKSAFTIKGKGLHTGREIEATFKPAPDNFGRKFLRIDVEGAAPIEAVAENVVETCRGTVMASGDLRISTVEHAIPCLTSMDTARELQRVMSAMRRRRIVSVVALQDLSLSWED